MNGFNKEEILAALQAMIIYVIMRMNNGGLSEYDIGGDIYTMGVSFFSQDKETRLGVYYGNRNSRNGSVIAFLGLSARIFPRAVDPLVGNNGFLRKADEGL